MNLIYKKTYISQRVKGIVSQNFRDLQLRMILMERTWVPGIPLKVNFFKSTFRVVF